MRTQLYSIFLFLLAAVAAAQAPSSTRVIQITVQDSSGALIPGAHIVVSTANGSVLAQGTSDSAGEFTFPAGPARTYIVDLTRDGFGETTRQIKAGSGLRTSVHVEMPIASVNENVTVVGSDTAAQLSTEISENQSGNAVDSNALDRLPVFDQDYIATMSRFLDADSSGTNGTTLVVNGVEANGAGVTASAIQSVKINQNPYTALYSRPGRARIEITTKGGTPQIHGSANFLYRDSLFDATNFFAAVKPSEQRTYFEGSVTGPLSRDRKTTFLAALDKDNDNQEAIVVAAGLNGPINANVPNPAHHYFLSGRVFHDYGKGNQFWIGYSYEHRAVHNQGVGGTVLPEAGTNATMLEHEINVGNTTILSPHMANLLHFLVGHADNRIQSINPSPMIAVSGAFTGGGAQSDRFRTESHSEGQDIVTYTTGRHEIKFGIDIPDISRRGFDDFTNQAGTYSFANLSDYASSQPFSYLVQSGQGHVSFLEKTVAGIFEDNIRLRPNLSISAGVRYYWQNYFHDIAHDIAPRFSFAWAPSPRSKTVVRGGGGVFFDRTGPMPISDLLHFNGVRLKQFIVHNPTYPVTPAQLVGLPSGIVSLDPRQRIPYTMQYGIGIEQQLNAASSLFVNYLRARGVDQFRSIDANAPPPPAYAARPNPNLGQQRLLQSEGYLKSNALEVGFRGRPVRYFTGQARYSLGKTYTNTSGITYFPANSYAPNADWGRSDNDQRHKFDLLGTFEAGKWFSFGTALSAWSGKPVNITTGSDDYNDGLSNARPAGVPRNALHGPGYLDLDINLAHEFPLTKDRRKGPSASLSLNSFNVLNHPNYVTYVGVVGSPFFAHAVAAQSPRKMQLQIELRF